MIFRRTIILALILVNFAVVGSARADDAPSTVVDQLHAALLHVMKDANSLGLTGRYDYLSPILSKIFDFQRMIAFATGSAWSSASNEEQAQLTDAFARLSIGTYAKRFDGYTGERFDILGERPGPRGSMLVDTQIVRVDQPPVPLTYVMFKRDSDWRVIDILVDKSLSEMAVRRSEYAQTLKDGGISQLIGAINAKADEMLHS